MKALLPFAAITLFAVFGLACQVSTSDAASSNGVKNVSVKDAQAAISKGGVQFIDVRTPEEFAAGHAADAINVPLDNLSSSFSTLKIDQPIYVICQTGSRSKKAAAVLVNNSFTNIYNVDGGTSAWAEAKLPMK